MVDAVAMPERGVLVALDISRKAIGIAVCDPDRVLATPLKTLPRQRWADDLARLQALFDEHKAAGLVVGLPLNMDGSSGPAAQSRRDLAARIKAVEPALPVLMQDERLTTEAVADAFAEGRWRRPKAGTPVDHFAAAIILEDAMAAIARAHKL